MFLTIGFSQTAAAQPPPGLNPSQFCMDVAEPFFQQANMPLSHPTCVTLVNNANGGDVAACKWALDVGVIATNEYGQCVSTGIPNLEIRIFQALIARGINANDLFVAFFVFTTFGADFGPTGLSVAVFASLLAGWLIMRYYRRKGLLS